MDPIKNFRDSIIDRYKIFTPLTKHEELALFTQLLDDSLSAKLSDLIHFFSGCLYFSKNEYKQAKNEFEESLKINSQNPLPLNGLGNVYGSQKKYAEAEEAFRQAIALDKKFAYPWQGLGTVYREQEEYAKAEEAFRQAIALDKKFAHPWHGLGTIYSDQQKYDMAEKNYLRAIALDENLASPWHGLGNIYFDLNQFAKAEEAYQHAIKLDEKIASFWSSLGALYGVVKNFSKAEEAYRQAIELDGKFADPWHGLGNVYSLQKKYTKAIEAYKHSIAFDNKDPHSYRNLAVSYEQSNKLDEAVENYQRAKILFESDNFWTSVCVNDLARCEKKKRNNAKFQIIRDIAKKGLAGRTNIPDKLLQLLERTREFEREVFANQESFEKFVKEEAVKDKSIMYLEVLRRWNSYTPIVADNYNISKGGGYFLSVKGLGIVIDPGFNFIDNFKGAGHCFDEIDVVMISHAHNDHTSDLESIITLLQRCNSRRKGIDTEDPEGTIRSDIAKRKNCNVNEVKIAEIDEEFYRESPRRKRIDLYLTKSVHTKFGGMLNSSSKDDYRYHIIEKEERKRISGRNKEKIDIRVIGAKHNDVISDQESVGFVFDLDGTTLIYTGDTGWDNDLELQYRELARDYKDKHIVLLAHLGGFKKYENDYDDKEDQNINQKCFYKNHLGRLGLGSLVDVVKPEVCLVSEFGEELREHRVELIKILMEIWNTGPVFIAADIGLKYDLANQKVYGITAIGPSECERDWIPPKNVSASLLYKDYSLHYYDAKSSISEAKLQHILGVEFERK